MSDPRLSAFRLGDVRGIYPDEIDEAFALSFARAFADRFGIRGTVAVGRDMRSSSEAIQAGLVEGLVTAGIDVLDLGLCATELGYYASMQSGVEAAIVVTASHNPARYNGFKCVLAHGEAVTFDTGLSDVMAMMISGRLTQSTHRGTVRRWPLQPEYIEFLAAKFAFDARHKSSATVALNGLNGTAATLASDIADAWHLPVTWFRKEPGPMPKEGADPANPGLAAEMKQFMAQGNFSLGVAWDGDCDRCVFFDGSGDLLPTYYMVGLLAQQFLERHAGAAIVFDTKLCWNTLDVIQQHGGEAIPSKTGHAFMKRKMREHNARYGGELSSHHFFGDFGGCDSGMLAWLTVLDIAMQSGRRISDLIENRRNTICCTPEINLRLVDAAAAFREIRAHYENDAVSIGNLDGLSVETRHGWRFSLTESKTEPLVRLNMESRAGPRRLLQEGAKLIEALHKFQSDNTDYLSRLVVL